MERFDVVIVGAGPAGLTAAIYAARARLSTVVLDESVPGGQVKTTHKVSNYPGFPEDVKGSELAERFTQQAQRFGADVRRAVEITAHDLVGPLKLFTLDDEEQIAAKAVIVATGAAPRRLGVAGEAQFKGRGLSYCATCDGAYFEGKSIHVIGGGNSAVEESLFLTRFASRVTIVHQMDHFQAEPASVEEALHHRKIDVMWSHEPRGFAGNASLERIRVENLKTGAITELPTDGAFIFCGMTPRTELLGNYMPLARGGYVETDEGMGTRVPGLFAAGDIRVKTFRQITTAVADGTIAALSAQRYVRELR